MVNWQSIDVFEILQSKTKHEFELCSKYFYFISRDFYRVSNESYHVVEYFVLKAWHRDEFSLELVEQVDVLVIDCMHYLIVPGKIWINEGNILHSMDYLGIE